MPQSLGLLVVSHGELAGELVKATRRIVGDVEALEAISIGWNDAADASGRRIEEAVRRLDRDHGVLLLTDMFGGTPTNLALSLLQEGKVEIIFPIKQIGRFSLSEILSRSALFSSFIRIKFTS